MNQRCRITLSQAAVRDSIVIPAPETNSPAGLCCIMWQFLKSNGGPGLLRLSGLILCWIGLMGCRGAATPQTPPTRGLVFRGMSDASAAVMLDSRHFVVGNDEDNVLRVYDLEQPGLPVKSLDCSSFLQVGGKNLESDFEGAARLGDRIFWIGSHSADRNGNPAPNRRRLFATSLSKEGSVTLIHLTGQPYSSLIEDLTVDPRYHGFNLDAAGNLPPKSPGALNIEGLSVTSDGKLLIGFRNPIPQGKALVAVLNNPNEVIQGRPARFDPPLLLDLGGNGIRDMGVWRGSHYILAGSFDPEKTFQLYSWSGPGTEPRLFPSVKFKHLNPEALAFEESLDTVLVLSDDGTRKVGGVESKRLPDPEQRQFRVARLNLNTLSLTSTTESSPSAWPR